MPEPADALPRDLLADVPEGMRARILDPWRWLTNDQHTLVAVSCFGDLFLSGPRGEPLMLDMLEGQITPIGTSWEAVTALLREADARDDLFLEGLAIAMRERGKVLRLGECYAWAVPPILGAPVDVSNLVVMELPVYEHIMGHLHRDLRARGPGCTVDGMTVDGVVPRDDSSSKLPK